MEQWVPKELPHVFNFFCDEKNLEILTPPWLHFKVLGKTTPQIEEGTLINYRLKIKGVPCYWQSKIEHWKNKCSFVDTQTKGPYVLWHHTHSFLESNGGTLMTDRVFFEVPLGWLGKILLHSLIEKDIKEIFEYRKRKVEEIFGKAL